MKYHLPMNMQRSTLLVVVPLFLVSCASPPPPREAPLSAVRDIKRFGVVSVSGREFIRQYVGITVFGNEREAKDITYWDLDSEYEKQLGTAAEGALGATFVKTEYARSEFLPVNDPNGPWDAPAFSDANWKGIESVVVSACQRSSLDALFVLTRKKSPDVFGGTNQMVAGVGIYARGSKSLLHLVASVGLLDCRTGKPLSARTILKTQELPEELARTPIPRWSKESEELVRKQAVSWPPVLWESTLRNMLP